jgi:hypothetical protein
MVPICALGNSFFITAYCGEERTDLILSFVQFKILSSGSAWINFIATSDKNSQNQFFCGSKFPFFDRKVRFQGMGLALLLLKLVQLHQCYHGNKPTLYVKVEERDAAYFQKIGFTTVDDEEEERLVTEEAEADEGVFKLTSRNFFLRTKQGNCESHKTTKQLYVESASFSRRGIAEMDHS